MTIYCACRIPENLSSYREHIQQRLPRRIGPGAENSTFLGASVAANGNADHTRGATASASGSSQSASSQANRSLLARSAFLYWLAYHTILAYINCLLSMAVYIYNHIHRYQMHISYMCLICTLHAQTTCCHPRRRFTANCRAMLFSST